MRWTIGPLIAVSLAVSTLSCDDHRRATECLGQGCAVDALDSTETSPDASPDSAQGDAPTDEVDIDLDADVSTGVQCAPDFDLDAYPIGTAARVMLPPSFAVADVVPGSGVLFQSPDATAFGMVLVLAAQNAPARVIHDGNLQRAVDDINDIPTLDFTRHSALPGADWRADTTDQVGAHTVVRSVLRFEYGDGSANPDAEAQAPGALRDALLSRFALSLVDPTPSAPCTTIAGRWTTTLFDDRPVVSVILACQDALDADPDLQQAFDLVYSGGHLLPDGLDGLMPRCDDFEAQAVNTPLDVVLVVDNSASMHVPQTHLADALPALGARLANDGLDARLGVTTTETWALSMEPFRGSVPDLSHDELLDSSASGLREPGFLPAVGADDLGLLARDVALDEGCDHGSDPDVVDPNTCGYGLERGVASAQEVFDRLRAAETAPGQPAAAHGLRQNATRAVVYVGNEPNEDAVVNFTVAPSSPEFRALVDAADTLHAQVGATAHAIVVSELEESLQRACIPVFGPIPPGGGPAFRTAPDYVTIAAHAGGGNASLCATDLRPAVEQIARATSAASSPYVLSGFPVAGTLRVSVDGQRVAPGELDGWTWDPDHNAVTLHGGARPAPGSRVSIAYGIGIAGE